MSTKMPPARLIWCVRHTRGFQGDMARMSLQAREEFAQRLQLGLLNAFCEMPGIFEESGGDLERIPGLMQRHAPACCYCRDKIEHVIGRALLGGVYGGQDNLILPSRPDAPPDKG